MIIFLNIVNGFNQSHSTESKSMGFHPILSKLINFVSLILLKLHVV